MRLIDADSLKELIKEHNYMLANSCNSRDYGMFTNGIMQAIDEQPTVEAEPAKHGKWTEHLILAEGFFQCSCCEFVSEALAAPRLYKYCPNCGAKMDLED